MSEAPSAAAEAPAHTFLERMLDGIERAGNKMPDPGDPVPLLCGAVIVISQILFWFDVKATFEVVKPPAGSRPSKTYYRRFDRARRCRADRGRAAGAYHVITETAKVQGLLTGEGVRYLFTSFVDELPQLRGRHDHPGRDDRRRPRGVGRADSRAHTQAGRRLVEELADPHHRLPRASSRASPPTPATSCSSLSGAAAFKSVGRNPLAGIAAAFAGVAAGFGVNFLITPLDGVLTEITNDAAGSGTGVHHIDLAANLYFGIGSTIFVALVLTLVSAKLVEGRLGAWDPADAGEGTADRRRGA